MLRKAAEEFVDQFLGNAIGQAPAKLPQPAIDYRIDIVSQPSAAIARFTQQT